MLFHVTYVTLPQVQLHFQHIYAETPNNDCCFSKKILWNLLQKCVRFTIQIYPKFGFVLVISFFIHPHKKDLLSTRLASCGPLCWTLSTEPSAKMRWLSKCNFPTHLSNEYHPLYFTGDTALETQLSYQYVLCDSCTKNICLFSVEGPHRGTWEWHLNSSGQRNLGKTAKMEVEVQDISHNTVYSIL
jgi:hypothetical protein